ncbi:MAG: outer membrane beta-barrel protein [Bacteroidetes bacterium]|jgi:hypothetical protein|nr:outer membrane beta-barrel protein [Bacteroidota bacterium]MBT6684724.1 outer membrane beta-barrel protein [Bacteroidota bacterium]MBT7143825.1 outer membrane beta-barrel protein [Bacteroidota bacterium]MBT7489994.1 outer membrane beta-barrel protein [Bacteroidota bacterium]
MKKGFIQILVLSLVFFNAISLKSFAEYSVIKAKAVGESFRFLKPQKLFFKNNSFNSNLGSNAYKNDIPKFQIGFSMGANLSDLIQDIEDPQKKLGTIYGILGIYNINNDYGFQLELNFSEFGVVNKESGVTGSGTFGSIATDAETTYDYLTVPIMLKRYFGVDIKFYLNAGLYYSFLRSAQIVGEQTIGTINSSGMAIETIYDLHDDLYRETLSNDYGVVGGFGGLFPLGSNIRRGPKLQLMLDARYSYGFADITLETTNKYSGITSDLTSKNSVFQIKAGLLINW